MAQGSPVVTHRDDGGDRGWRRGATIRKEEQKLPLSLAGNGLMAGIQAASSSGPLRALQIPRMLSAFQPDCAAWRADIFTE